MFLKDDARAVFRENLTYYMEQKSVSQQDLVNALNVSKSAVSDWVHGKNYPRIDVMQRLSDYFNVNMDRLTMTNLHEDEYTDDERHLVAAYRKAEPPIKKAALRMLEESAAEQESKKQDTVSGQTA
jgi:repressor LexA